jgi:hypothetical protein
MLSQVYLGSMTPHAPEMDLHRHAEVACWRARVIARLMRLFTRRPA